jgi:glycosyltransferase involved in cell wall biosynthesis
VKREHISVLYNGVAQLLTRTPDFTKKIRRIGVIGRIEPEKGQLHFVYAARSVLRLFPDCKFVVIGAPLFSGTEYLNTVIGSSIGLPVEFLGWRDDIGAVLSNLDLLAVPSAPVDSAPRVILEAFAARVPVVAFGSGGIPELIRDGETGFLTIANTPAALANRIRSILTMNPFSIRAVVDRAYESWRNRYSLDIYQKRVSDFIAQHYDQSPADIH